jgi:hypothetical protein
VSGSAICIETFLITEAAMSFMKTVVSILFLLLIFTANLSYADIVSSFGASLEGWTLEGNGILSCFSAGGNPGGYAHWADQTGTLGDGWLIAPSAFLGNWSIYNGIGSLSWDHIIISTGDVGNIVTPSAIISGPGGTATYTGGQFQTSWHTLSAPINASSWTVNSGSWSSILNNVTSLKIRMEAVWNKGALDVDGMDNIRLAPEPSGIMLLGIGAFGLLCFYWRTKK